MVQAYCKAKSIVLSDIMQPEYMEKVMTKYGFRDWDAVLAAIGHGGVKEGQVVNKLVDEHEKIKKKNQTDQDVLEALSEMEAKPLVRRKNKGGIVVKGIDDVAARCSRCCNPVPGDEIVGFVTRGRGVSIHRTDCINILNLPELDRVRLIDAEWSVSSDKMDTFFTAEIKIYTNNRVGVLLDITRIFTENKIDISGINVRMCKNGTATIDVAFEIKSKDQLVSIISKLRSVESIIDVERTTG
jgi:GTP pyrophosphokinase